jgi:hypothetical protein
MWLIDPINYSFVKGTNMSIDVFTPHVELLMGREMQALG